MQTEQLNWLKSNLKHKQINTNYGAIILVRARGHYKEIEKEMKSLPCFLCILYSCFILYFVLSAQNLYPSTRIHVLLNMILPLGVSILFEILFYSLCSIVINNQQILEMFSYVAMYSKKQTSIKFKNKETTTV